MLQYISITHCAWSLTYKASFYSSCSCFLAVFKLLKLLRYCISLLIQTQHFLYVF